MKGGRRRSRSDARRARLTRRPRSRTIARGKTAARTTALRGRVSHRDLSTPAGVARRGAGRASPTQSPRCARGCGAAGAALIKCGPIQQCMDLSDCPVRLSCQIMSSTCVAAAVVVATLGYRHRSLPPSAWNGSWNEAPDGPSAVGAIRAMTRAICAGSARSAWGRTSCKRQGRVEEVTDEPQYRDRVCGIDIGKAQMVATIRVPSDKDSARRAAETRTFGTTKREVLALADWLRCWQVPAVVMEATGDYWKGAALPAGGRGVRLRAGRRPAGQEPARPPQAGPVRFAVAGRVL